VGGRARGRRCHRCAVRVRRDVRSRGSPSLACRCSSPFPHRSRCRSPVAVGRSRSHRRTRGSRACGCRRRDGSAACCCLSFLASDESPHGDRRAPRALGRAGASVASLAPTVVRVERRGRRGARPRGRLVRTERVLHRSGGHLHRRDAVAGRRRYHATRLSLLS
jgi:hypothetical protein